MWGTGHLYSLKECPHKLLINSKARNDNSAVEKLPFNWVIKVNIASMGPTDKLYFLVGCIKQNTVSLLWYFSPKRRALSLIMQKYQANPNWGTFCEAADLCSSKMLVLWKTKTEIRCSGLMETESCRLKMHENKI